MMPFADPALRALNRFGLGARPGERGRLEDPGRWLRGQLDGGAPKLRGELPSGDEIGAVIRGLREAQRARDQDALRERRREIRRIVGLEAVATLSARVSSERPFVERLVAFWSNHLCVSVQGEPAVLPMAGMYEREVIRPHVLGRFEDMVLASARHPAMLIYLDNAQSIGPESRAGRMTARRGNARGLNENYARELLELHTLGVDGGYAQEDVVELARVLTGWGAQGVGRGRGPRVGPETTAPAFRFAPPLHEPGAKTVLGVRYREGGVGEGEAVIRDLCRHPSTARFLAGKLVRHFVADDPPAAAVDQVAAVFADSGGDLRETALALVDLDEAWDPANRKFRTPQDWLVAVLRVLGAKDTPREVVEALRQLRHTLWAPGAPKGYGDTRREWADPDALMNRAELARSISRRIVRDGGRPDPERLLDAIEVGEDSELPRLLGDGGVAVDERLALALAGPDFQWR
ncbi:MAG: DUF1800 domain-containing protein [Gemmatimonadota bacterium]